MKKYDKSIDDRKELVKRLSELTGLDAHYTRVPRCAYEVGPFTVEKDGCLTMEEGADENIIETLTSENLIGVCIEETHPVSAIPGELAAQIIQPNLRTEEWDEDEWEEPETPAEAYVEQEVWRPETDIFAEIATQTTGETENLGAVDSTVANVIPNSEYWQETKEESAASISTQGAEEMKAFPLDAKISFPLSKHTVASLTNLICMIHTRGPLVSKATGGNFRVDKDLVDDILDRHAFSRPEALIGFVQEWDGSEKAITGIAFEDDKVIFDGFMGVKDSEHLQAFMKLAAAMNKMAQTQKRIQAKETDDSNEKYSLRVWLIRLGLNGPEYKAERKILMENLSGHAAFRTPEDEVKWKARQNTKKLALKAAKEEKERIA